MCRRPGSRALVQCLLLALSGKLICGEGRTFNLLAVGDEQTFGGLMPWPGSGNQQAQVGSSTKEGYTPERYLDPLRTMIAENGRAVNFVGSCCRLCRGKGFMKMVPECVRGCAPNTRRIHHVGFAKWSSSQMLSGEGPSQFRTTEARAFKDWVKETYRIPDVALLYLGTHDVAQGVPPQKFAANVAAMVAEVRSINQRAAFIVASALPSSPDPATAAKFAALKGALDPLLRSESLNTTISPVYAVDAAAGADPRALIATLTHPGSPPVTVPNGKGAKHVAGRFASVLLPLLDRLEREGGAPPGRTPAPPPRPAAGVPPGTAAGGAAGGLARQAGGSPGVAKGGGARLAGGGHVRSGQKVHVNLSGESDRDSMVMVAAAAAAIAGLLCGASFVLRRWRSARAQRPQGGQYELVAPGASS